MLSRFLIFTLCALSAFSINIAQANNLLTINLDKRISPDTESKAQWFIEYASEKKLGKIFFHNSSNFSRASRWSPLSDAFEITTDGEYEIIQRKDKSEFSRVTFKLTPSYTHLPKNYAPFSPFSDGGMAIHTGRFFACDDKCDQKAVNMNMSLSVPKDQHIILDGQIHYDQISWKDSAEGRSVYIGQQKPTETAGTLSLVDSGLPAEIKKSFDRDIPKLMNYFEKELGSLIAKEKPTLFASYAKVKGTSTQGGTLPNQVFMHWNHDDLDEKIHDKTFVLETLFFFAHEVAHLFQRSATIPSPNTQAWIHEGSADFFALEALAAIYPEAKNYIQEKQLDSQKRCETSLTNHVLSEASDNGDFKAHYYCGLLIHQRIAKEIAKADEHITLSTLWKDYRREVQSGKPAGQETFLSILNHYSNDDFSNKIRAFINNRHSNPSIALNQLSK